MGGKLVIILFLGAAIVLGEPGSLLYSECSGNATVKRVLQSADIVEVRHSVAGDSETCYAVSVKTGDGSVVEGYLLGAAHPAVNRFERQEEVYIAQALTPPQPKALAARAPAHRKRAARKMWNPFGTK